MPTEQAMEAARGMDRATNFHVRGYIPVETVAAHLDRVDAVVREAIEDIEMGHWEDRVKAANNLRTLLLSDPKPDAVKVLAGALGDYVIPGCPWDDAIAALRAAGLLKEDPNG